MAVRIYLSTEDINAYRADEFESRHLNALADKWQAQTLSRLNLDVAPSPTVSVAPTPSDSLTNPLGNASAGSMTDTVVPPVTPSPSPAGPLTEPAPALPTPVQSELPPPRSPAEVSSGGSAQPPPGASLPAPTAPPLTDFGPVPRTSPQRPIAAPPAAPVPSPAPTPLPTGGWVDYARQAAIKANIDPDLFTRQINQESGFDPTALSPAGARGIAQIVPKYHPGVDTSDPKASLDYAANLMASLLKKHGGDIRAALVEYNGGQGAVNALNAGTPYAESVDYVNKILKGGAAMPSTQDPDKIAALQSGDWQRIAQAQLGKPYIWGSVGGRSDFSQDATGFDCSGFVSYVWKNGLGLSMPAFTGDIQKSTQSISASEAKPGDLVMLMNSPDPTKQHVGIYIGNGQMIDSTGGGVHVESVWSGMEYRRDPRVASKPGAVLDVLDTASNTAIQRPNTPEEQDRGDQIRKTLAPTPDETVTNPFGEAFRQVGEVTQGALNVVKAAPSQVQSPNTGNAAIDALGTGASALGTAVHTIGEGVRNITPTSELARGATGMEQIVSENRALYDQQQRLVDEFAGAQTRGDEAAMQRIRGEMDALQTQLPDARNRDVLHAAAERNPSTGLVETGANLAGAAIAAPLVAAGAPVATRAVAAAIDPATGLPSLAGRAIESAGPALRTRQRGEGSVDFASGGTSRFFHGTGSDFPRPDPAKFDQNGLFGPGYYLTDSPIVAGGVVADEGIRPGYAQQRAAQEGLAPEQKADLLRRVTTAKATLAGNPSPELRAYVERDMAQAQARLDTDLRGTGANVRPVDVPQNLRMLDAEAPPPADIKQILQADFDRTYPNHQPGIGPAHIANDATLADLYTFTERGGYGSRESMNRALAQAGYDGIQYSGGKRIPMQDSAGQDIEHTAMVVFPQSLDKIRNALSGTQGGAINPRFATTLGGAAAGGGAAYAETDPNDPNRGLKVVGGVLAGGALGYTAGRITENPALLRTRQRGEGINPFSPPRLSETTPPSVTGPKLARMAGTAAEQAAVGTAEEGRAANILLDKFPEDVRPHLQDVADRFGQFAGQRRGVITDDEATRNAARVALGTTPEQWVKTPAGKAFNQEQAIALGNTLSQVGQEYDSLLNEVQGLRAAGSVTPEKEAELADKTLEFAALAGVRSGAAAEAGRALRAFRQVLGGGGYANRNKAIDAAFKAIGTDKERFAQWVEAFSQLPDNDPIAKYKMLQGLQEPSWWDRISILRYASMLSSTSTHLVNAFGNTLNVGLDVALKPVSVGIDVARARATGGERTRYMGELAPQVRGLLEGATTGLVDGLTAFKTGINPQDIGKFENVRSGFQSGSATVDMIAEAPLRLLTFSDNVFRSAAKGAQVRALAAREGIKAGKSGTELRTFIDDVVTNLPLHPDIAEEASKLAARAVLQEPNALASAVTSIGRGAGSVDTAKRIVREIVVPFSKTPLNILGQGLEMSPLGAFKVRDLATAGDVGGATDAAARAAFGSALMVGVGALAANGLVTGGYPADAKERETLPPGWQPWSLRLPNGDGGHKYISFSQLGPVAVPMAIAAVAGQSLREGVVADPTTLASSLGRFMLDQTFLQGLSSIVDAVKDPKRYGENVTEQLATSFVPYAAFSRQLTRALDQADRDPKGAIEAIQAIIPGVAGNVPRRQDALGREIHSTQSGVGTFVSPTRYSTDQPEPLMNAFREIGEGIPGPPSEIRITSKITNSTSPPIKLTDREQDAYQRFFGQKLTEIRGQQVTSPDWKTRSLAGRKASLDVAVKIAREFAGNEVYKQMVPDDRQKRMQEGRARQQVKPLPPP